MHKALFTCVWPLLFMLTSCSPSGFHILEEESAENANQCLRDQIHSKTLFSSRYSSVFEVNQKKIFANEFPDGIEANQQLIVQVRHSCFYSSKTSSSWIEKAVRRKLRSENSDIGFYSVRSPVGISFLDFEELLNLSPCVIGVSPNQNLELASLDPMNDEQESLDTIRFQSAWESYISKVIDPVLVAVVDSGSDQMHADMVDRHWRNIVELNGQPGKDDDNNGYIDDIFGYSWACYIGGDKPSSFFFVPHGEHVSGIIAANTGNGIGISGVAGQKSKIMHLNVVYSGDSLKPCDPGDQELMLAVQAIKYAADNGAKVINLSLGGWGHNSALRDVINYAVSKGVFLAAAAGNNNHRIQDTPSGEDFFIPCGYAKDLNGFACVGAFDGSQQSQNGRCSFSNYSTDFVELSAPGCDSSDEGVDYGRDGILSTVRMSQAKIYQRMPGTSMAVPHVSAAAAVAIGYYKTLTGVYPSPAKVEEYLSVGSKTNFLLTDSFRSGLSLDLRFLMETIDQDIKNQNSSCR